jgi:NAD(P)H-flavin reductase
MSSARYESGHLVPVPAQIINVRQETGDIFTLVLQRREGNALPFLPGQFNMLYAFAVGEAAISISGDPHQADYMAHTIRAVGSVTNALAKMQTGDVVGIRGPFGTPWPIEAALGRDLLLISGGIGLAPLRPVLHHVLRRRNDFARVLLLHGSRTPADILYASELAHWQSRKDLQVLITVDRADTSWSGRVGVVPSLVRKAVFDVQTALAFICGPEVMMRFALAELQARGVGNDQIFVSLERNMQCAVGFCGHCQFGPEFVCMDGPTFRYDRIEKFFTVPEA